MGRGSDADPSSSCGRSPAKTRAARNWRPQTMLDLVSIDRVNSLICLVPNYSRIGLFVMIPPVKTNMSAQLLECPLMALSGHFVCRIWCRFRG